MNEFVEVKQAVKMFARQGHAFYPDRYPGVGDITVVCIGNQRYKVQCNSKDFCKRLIRWFCLSERLLSGFAYEMLGQRKHAPLVLREDLTLIPFWYPKFENRAHRAAYVSLFSVMSYKIHRRNSAVTLILKDNHTVELAYSFQQVKKQIIHADYIFHKYLTRFRADGYGYSYNGQKEAE